MLNENTVNDQLLKKLLIDIQDIKCEQLQDELFTAREVSLHILRLDTIHPVVSGNKLFKLHYFLEAAKHHPGKPIITFGGAYSNHLVAAAFACKENGLKSIGIVRGEKPSVLSHTLQECISLGMKLKFISRELYATKENASFKNELLNEFGDSIFIPEGGYDINGAKGAALIMDMINKDVTHICCAVGTATTIAGLLIGSNNNQRIIAVPVLKGMIDIEERVAYLTQNKNISKQLHIENGYHFGGYAKGNKELFDFMNRFFKQHVIPTDFVYTGKMMYAVYDLIHKNYFKPGSKIVCVHTGGLQGNLSLPKGTLTF